MRKIFLIISFLLLTNPSFAATRTIAAAGGNWSDNATWDEGVAPTTSDDVVARGDGTSGNVTISATSNCRSAVFTNYSGILTHNTGITLNVGASGSGAASFTFVPGMTYSPADSTAVVSFEASANINLTSAGKTFGRVTIAALSPGGVTLLDNLTMLGLFGFSRTNFNANGFNVTASSVASNNNNSRTFTMGSGTFTISGTGDIWDFGGSNFTVNSNTSTILLTDTSSSAKTFIGAGGKVYNNLTVTAGGSGILTFESNTTFNIFTINPPKTVRFTSGDTFNFTSFLATGLSGNIITITSTTNGSIHTLSKTSGTVSSDWLSLRDSNATGGAVWQAGRNSINVSNNRGWIFVHRSLIRGNSFISGVSSIK